GEHLVRGRYVGVAVDRADVHEEFSTTNESRLKTEATIRPRSHCLPGAVIRGLIRSARVVPSSDRSWSIGQHELATPAAPVHLHAAAPCVGRVSVAELQLERKVIGARATCLRSDLPLQLPSPIHGRR